MISTFEAPAFMIWNPNNERLMMIAQKVKNRKMITSGEYAHFLYWNEDDPITAYSVEPAIVALFSMVRNGFNLDEELASKASKLISLITQRVSLWDYAEKLWYAVGRGYEDKAEGFVDSIVMLLSSPHPSVFRNTMKFTSVFLRCFDWVSRFKMVSSHLIPKVLSALSRLDRTVIDEKELMDNIKTLFVWCSDLSAPIFVGHLAKQPSMDSRIVNNVPSLLQISRYHLLTSWRDGCEPIMDFMFNLFELSVKHQPALDFVCSSHIPMIYQSLLSKLEVEDTKSDILWCLPRLVSTWQTDKEEEEQEEAEEKDEIVVRMHTLFQIYEKEGCGDGLEQTLFHDHLTAEGKFVRKSSYNGLTYLGMNSRLE
ncbi:hypothetical protein BLNAU_6137 [Blattamonas nauphoetae]|uniref:Uncharacterized protein n=1 Tax=Blattamonas nauphoetae TaxID=2049346 RepID=A0ABQ9Y568_9EUKA|nr:hypothetical protein BLNAU_6137 [Blattamonas nauphoetae]